MEIKNSLLFIKDKLNEQTTDGVETESLQPYLYQSKEGNVIQDQDYDEVNTENNLVDSSLTEKPNAAAKSFAIECIPPVRPQRAKKTSKINVPDWTPPKNDLMTYFFSCIKPKVSD